MIWFVFDVIVYVLCLVELKVGDLIFIGMLVGVGVLQLGDCVMGGVDGIVMFEFVVGVKL